MNGKELHNSKEHPDSRPDDRTSVQPETSVSTEEKETVAGFQRSVKEYIEQNGLAMVDHPANHLDKFLHFMADGDRMDRLNALMDEQRMELDPLEILEMQGSEQAHSGFLAWILNPGGNHEIGHEFLLRFLEMTVKAARGQGIPTVCPGRLDTIDWADVEVRREWQNIDILVLSEKSRFVCAIENKIYAAEGIREDGRSQLTDYRRVLKREFPRFDTHLVFLSPSGMESTNSIERKYWVPENYETVRQLISECRQKFEGIVNQEAVMFLGQYERTLRRHIVPETSEINKLATEIYLEYRNAIEFISGHKPDYRAGIKEILREAIGKQEGWILCPENNEYVRFKSSDWDQFEELKTGTSWKPDSDSLLLFEFWCPTEPTSTRGPALTLCQGTNRSLRRHLIETVKQNEDRFNVRCKSLQDELAYIHDFKLDLLRNADLGTGWIDGPVRDRLMERVERFAKEEFPRINEAVIKSLQEYQAGSLEAGK